MNQKLASLSALSLGVVATVLLTVGLGQTAAKLDPVVGKSQAIRSDDRGYLASLPCVGGSGGGDPDDRAGTVVIVA